jgi:hypothetical protein
MPGLGVDLAQQIMPHAEDDSRTPKPQLSDRTTNLNPGKQKRSDFRLRKRHSKLPEA